MERDFLFGCGEYSGDGVLIKPGRLPGCLEMILVLRGSITAKTAMCTFDARAGDLFFLPPDTVRTVTAREGSALVLTAHFSVSLFDGMSESIDRDLFYMFLIQLRTRDNRIRPNTPLYMDIRRAMENCYGEYLSKELCYSLRIRGQLCMMMAALLSSYSATRENDRMVYHNVLRLRPTLRYIETHSRGRISVPELAEQLLVTPDYYTKLFRESIGKTTVDYINCERVNQGMILLLETEMSVSEVAEQVGLGSSNYFSKLFKATVGVNPLTFRKSAR